MINKDPYYSSVAKQVRATKARTKRLVSNHIAGLHVTSAINCPMCTKQRHSVIVSKRDTKPAKPPVTTPVVTTPSVPTASDVLDTLTSKLVLEAARKYIIVGLS